MSDSLRPANAMSAAPNGFAPRSAAMRTTGACGLRSLALATTLLPLATWPLQAATKHPAAHKAAPVAKTAVAKTHVAVAAPAKPSRGAGRKGAPAEHVVEAKAPATGKRAPLTPREALAAKAAAYREQAAARAAAEQESSKAAKPGPALVAARAAQTEATKTAAAAKATPPEDVAADAAVLDRVHAWMRARGAADSVKAAKPMPEPDLSPVARKATADDFDRAARQQAQVLHATAEQNQARTTADDDAAAAAASHIPSTAPTARVAAPFVHGELLSAASAGFTAQGNDGETETNDAVPQRAKTPDATVPKLMAKPAPIVRQAPAAAAVANAAKPPQLAPQTASQLADANLDGDVPAPMPAMATALNPKALKTEAVNRSAMPDEDGEDVTRSTGAIAKVDLYDSRGRLRMLPAMKGSHEILVHQNQMAMADGLDRIEDDAQLDDMRRLKLLVALPDNDSIQVNDGMPANRRYARPWTVRFLNDLARAHFARFHTPLTITSAVRTVAFQRRLMLTNGNAAPPNGEVASPHLYGQAVDLGKHGMSMTEIAWMRAYLTPIEAAGKIDVEEEFQQACFHISVYRRYLGLPTRKNAPQPAPAPSRTLLQAKGTTPPAKHRRLPSALLATGLR